MPHAPQFWLPRAEILRFHEVDALVDVLLDLGVRRVRITGGEPLLRRDLPTLVAALAAKTRIADLALTTNGLLLARYARALRDAGLGRVTVSLDTLRRDRFESLTRVDALKDVLAGIDAALAAGLHPVKVDAVVLRGSNDDELIDLLEFGSARGLEVRFIEHMNVGGMTSWSPNATVDRATMLAAIAVRYGAPQALGDRGTAPAQRYRLSSGRTFGIVAGTTAPFCGVCDRSRLTADGMWYSCLHAAQGLDLKAPLRAGQTPAQIRELARAAWQERMDRGAEELAAGRSPTGTQGERPAPPDPHRLMHTRGG